MDQQRQIVFVYFLAVIISTLSHSHNRIYDNDPPRGRKLIVLLINGLSSSWSLDDDRYNLSGFIQLRVHGTRAAYVKPEFPSLSLPNQYSLLTGLHPGKHGVSSDVMYDKEKKRYFMSATEPGDFDPQWWNRTEPVWVTAGKQGVSTVLYWWRGCQVPFKDRIDANIECIPLKHSQSTDSLHSIIPSIIHNISNKQSRLVLINYEMINWVAQTKGIYSVEVIHHIERVSKILEELQTSLTESDLWSTTNLIVLSDHGQHPVRSDTNVQFVDDYFQDSHVIEATANDGAFMMIFPISGKEYQVFQELHGKIPNVSVYTVNDLLRTGHWGYRTAAHLAPIVLVADPGFAVYRRNRFHTMNELPLSLSGYDSNLPSMRAVFYARGPDFKSDHQQGHFRMVDIYQILCHILSLHCHKHDGSWDRVSMMFPSENPQPQMRSSGSFFRSYHVLISLVLLLIGYRL